MKKALKTVLINTDNHILVNKNTGEEKSLPRDVLGFVVDTKRRIMKYDEYFSIDSSLLRKLQDTDLNLQHLGLIVKIAVFLTSGSNICLRQDKSPLTTKDISKQINRTERATKLLLNKLENLEIVRHAKLKNFRKKVYVINPYLVKKGSEIDQETLVLFPDPSKLEKRINQSNDLKNFESASIPSLK